MKNQLKNLSKVVIATAVLTGTIGSAFAENIGFTGIVTNGVCTLRFYNAGVVTSSVGLPPISTTDMGTSIGYPAATVNPGVAINIKAETAGGTVCNLATLGSGVLVTTFNTKWQTNGGTEGVVTGYGTKALNAAASGAAANVTIDLVPSGTNAFTTGLNLAGTTALTQHGLSPAALATGQTFTAKYLKTNTTAATGGNVAVNYTVTAEYN